MANPETTGAAAHNVVPPYEKAAVPVGAVGGRTDIEVDVLVDVATSVTPPVPPAFANHTVPVVGSATTVIG